MLEPFVGDLGLVQVQVLQFFQFRDMLESGIRDAGSFQVEPPQGGKILQVSESRTGYFRISQV